MKIYEAIDVSDDEMYFPIGWWDSLDNARQAFNHSTPDMFDSSGSDTLEKESYIIEVKERSIGFSDNNGKTVGRIEWTCFWNDERDDFEWSRTHEEWK